MKLCRDCANFGVAWVYHDDVFGKHRVPACKIAIDPVYGSDWSLAWIERAAGKCGPEGKLFEVKT